MCAQSRFYKNEALYADVFTMIQRPTVLLLIPHLGGGGAERVTALLARGLSPYKYDVHLCLITESVAGSDVLPAPVTVHNLGARRVRRSALHLLRLVQQLNPDLVLSGMAHLNFLVLALRPFFPRKTRVVIRQNTTVSSVLDQGQSPFYTRFLYRTLYPYADQIVCQTQSMAADLMSKCRLGESRVQVLPNPVDLESIRSLGAEPSSRWSGPGPHLLAIGRLSSEKGFDLLLEAFASLRLAFPAADLTIVGSGPEETALKELRRTLRMEDWVHFPGHVSHPESYYPETTLFVLSSRFEGLPNALLEAAAGGLPIAALPSSDGVVDLLSGKAGTWLGSSISSKALVITMLAALHSIRPRQRFPHSWVEPFCMDHAIQRYEHLIDRTLRAELQ
jgi:glycosyltransferase involved in cell wall biosynthesis